MSTNPLISIVVPVFNVENYISKCIESLTAQTYSNIEIVVVDDGSSDNSLLMCKKIKERDKRIKIICKENGGVSSARNEGIAISSGEYICFVDGDDYVSQDYVEYLYNLCANNSTDISLTTDLFSNYKKRKTKKTKCIVFSGKDAAIYLLCYRIPIGCYCKLFKRSFLVNNRILFFDDLIMGEGFNFNFLSFQACNKVAVGNKRIYYYRQDNESSATSRFSIEKCINGLKAVNRIRENTIFDDELTQLALDFALWRTTTDMYTSLMFSNERFNYLEYKSAWLKVIKRKPKRLNKLPINRKNALRTILMSRCPRLVLFLMKVRMLFYKTRMK